MKKSMLVILIACLTSLSNAQIKPVENFPQITLERAQSLPPGEYTNISINGVTLKQIFESQASASSLNTLFSESFEVVDMLEDFDSIIFKNSQLRIQFEEMGENTFQLTAVVIKPNQTVKISGIEFKIGDSISKLSVFKISPQGFMDFYESKDDPVVLSDNENYFQVIIDTSTNLIRKIQFMCY
ncbi:hypothetical protein N9L20_09505 [Flavobacteriaceae bacterium]|nr:hypothetical protein [Flavobacteriaceae bacterium]